MKTNNSEAIHETLIPRGDLIELGRLGHLSVSARVAREPVPNLGGHSEWLAVPNVRRDNNNKKNKKNTRRSEKWKCVPVSQEFVLQPKGRMNTSVP